MTEIQIDSVLLPPEPSDQLWGCSIQVPLIGSGDVGFWIHVGGYVSGRWRPAAAVEFVEADNVVRVAAVRISRPDVALSRPGEREVEFCGFYTLVDARKLSAEFDLRLAAILEDGSRVPMGSIRGRHRYHVAATEQSPQGPSPPPERASADGNHDEPPIPSIKDDLKRLLADVETSLSEVESSLLDRLVLAGKSVLDLGAGTGERARAARARGAALVDGIEPDPERVALARLLSAYHDSSRVFFHQARELLEGPGREEYDVVLAVNGFDLVRDHLDAIAAIARGVLVTELPAADPDRAAALEAAGAGFPFHELLELSSGLTASEQRGSRTFLVGAADEATLRSALLGRDGVTATQ